MASNSALNAALGMQNEPGPRVALLVVVSVIFSPLAVVALWLVDYLNVRVMAAYGLPAFVTSC